MSDETALVAGDETALVRAQGRELIALARTPDEMRAAQASMIGWVTDKIRRERAEVAELDENYKIAQASKWRSGLLKRHLERAKARVEFFVKIKAALDAGYCIVPDFPIDLFAVRVSREGPRPNTTHADAPQSQSWGPHAAAPAEQVTDAPALGVGANVSPRAEVVGATGEEEGSGRKWAEQWATEFRDVDFPFALARTEIVDAASRAAALKVFDEMGVMIGAGDNRPGRQPERNPDPLVIGRVVLPMRHGLRRHAVAFLVTWHLDLRDFDRIK